MRLIRRYWTIIRRPSVHFSLGFLTVGGFIGGIVFWGAFNTAMESTNTETFCTGCHEMRDNVFVELKSTIHYTNRSGVRAMCSNCHVPHDWTDKMARKMQASKEVWGKIFGTIDTQEKFRDKRLELAQHEWARFKANDSLECRNCHNYDSMDFTRQSVARAEHAFDLPGQQGEDLHRLPQGHCAQASPHPAGSGAHRYSRADRTEGRRQSAGAFDQQCGQIASRRIQRAFFPRIDLEAH